MSGIEEIAGLVMAIEELKPAVEKAVPILLSMGPSFVPLIESAADLNVDITDRMIKRYMKIGYAKSEAVKLTMWNKQQVLQNMKSNK